MVTPLVLRLRRVGVEALPVVVEVEVIGIEQGYRLERLQVGNGDGPALPDDQPLLAHLLERAVNVHRRHAGGIRKLLLSDRQLEAVLTGLAVGQPDARSEEHTSELQSRQYLVCRLLLEQKIGLL